MQGESNQDLTDPIAKATKGLNDFRAQMRSYLALKSKSPNPATLVASLDKLNKQLDSLRSSLDLGQFANWLKQERESIARQQDEFKTRLASDLPRLLANFSFKIEGSFPKLHTSYYTLVLDFNGNTATVWYGPEDTMLRKVSLDPASIADALREEHQRLTERSVNPNKFLELLYRAYVLLSSQTKKEKVPLGQLLPVVAMLNQETEFLNDPTRERYRTYGRAQFSYDLYKASGKAVDGKHIELDTATMSESKKKSDYLWVPSNDQGAGHIKSAIWFREVG